MKYLKELWWRFQYGKLAEIRGYFYNKKMKRLYPDYKDDEYNCGELKHIWGLRSVENFEDKSRGVYDCSDIDISYDRKTKKYMLGIETAYVFQNIQSECDYLKDCLNAFSRYMDENNLSKDNRRVLFFGQPCTNLTTDSIEELYTEFRIFVEGFCKVNET